MPKKKDWGENTKAVDARERKKETKTSNKEKEARESEGAVLPTTIVWAYATT